MREMGERRRKVTAGLRLQTERFGRLMVSPKVSDWHPQKDSRPHPSLIISEALGTVRVVVSV